MWRMSFHASKEQLKIQQFNFGGEPAQQQMEMAVSFGGKRQAVKMELEG